MAIQPFSDFSVPEATARVARSAFPKGNTYMMLRDHLGTIFSDHDFADLYSPAGQTGLSSTHLALVTILQFAEDLSDRQAAEAVRSRIDWKYLLGLELTDSGFDASVLVEFRTRLVNNSAENRLLDRLLVLCKSQGLLCARGQQRTDSTHILATVRSLNRLEMVGETVRHALEALISVHPEWLTPQMDEAWYDRYEFSFDQYRLPQKKDERQALANQIGYDGLKLYQTIVQDDTVRWILQIPAIEVLRQIWIQQYLIENDTIRWRTSEELPPAAIRIQSPYDLEVRYATKRGFSWVGYKGHLTETCDQERPNLITHVETTRATTPDDQKLESIHQALRQKEILPDKHLVDAGYSEADQLVRSQKMYDIELVSPVAADTSWQAQDPQRFDLTHFQIDWQRQKVTCPNGHVSQRWEERQDKSGKPVIDIAFSQNVCGKCPLRSQCTSSKRNPRRLRVRPQELHQALQHQRQYQQTQEFKDKYAVRSGVEGTISLAVEPYPMRRTRYIGLRKTHFQNMAIAAAININRIANWIRGKPKARTRISKIKNLKLMCEAA